MEIKNLILKIFPKYDTIEIFELHSQAVDLSYEISVLIEFHNFLKKWRILNGSESLKKRGK
jgi:hypothetical protein